MSYWDSYNAAFNAGQQTGNVLADALKQREQRQFNAQVGQSLVNNDYDAAAKLYAGRGDLENVQRAQQMGQQRQATQQEQAKGYLLNAANALLQVPEAETQARYMSEVRPVLQQMGAPEDLLRQLDTADKSHASLRTFAAALGGQAQERAKLEFRDIGGGVTVAFDPYTGKEVSRVQGTQKPSWQQGFDADGNPTLIDANQYAPGVNGVATYVGPGGSGGMAQPPQPPAQGDDLWGRLLQRESGGRQTNADGSVVTSSDGAFGIAQLMPDTALEVATKLGDPSMAERARTDANVNEALGRVYFQQQLQDFGGNEALALAAYNAGPGRVQGWIGSIGDPREIGNEAWAARIPIKETREYVQGILGLNGGGRQAQPQGQGGQGGVRFGSRRDEPAPVLPAETGLVQIGDSGFYRNKVGQVFQPAKDGVKRLSGPTDAQVDAAGKRLKTINQLLTLVDAVDQQLAKTRTLGPGGRYVVNQKEMATLDSLTKQLQLAFKNAAELGAITGPDVPFIEAVAPDPRQFRALVLRGEYKPRLHAIARIAGENYRDEIEQFETLGGDPNGLQPLFRSPRSTTPYDRQGRQTPKPAGGDFEVRVVGE